MKVGPIAGGCWYCDDDEGPMYFCWEFDTNLHLECLKKELKWKEDNPFDREESGYPYDELDCIASEFKEVLEQEKI